LIASGLDIKTVSARLGHASTSFTLDIYGHVLPGNQAAAAEKFDMVVLSELVKDDTGGNYPGPPDGPPVSKMLAKGERRALKRGGDLNVSRGGLEPPTG